MTMNEQDSSELPAVNTGCRPKVLELIHKPDSTSNLEHVKPESVMNVNIETVTSQKGWNFSFICQRMLLISSALLQVQKILQLNHQVLNQTKQGMLDHFLTALA